MEVVLSVIIPVYKVEQYIKQCLDSLILSDGVLNNGLEVVIVNDGSPDKSGEMCQDYVNRFPNVFRLINKENGGHGSAWNVGLREAKGKYVRFLDSDDWLLNLQDLMVALSTTDADIVFTDYMKYYMNGNRFERHSILSEKGKLLYLSKHFLDQQEGGSFSLNFWSATYKTSILQSQCPLFAEHVFYDDSILMIAPLLYGRTFVSFDFPLYNYRIGREGQSMSPSIVRKNIDSYFTCYQHMVKWVEEHQLGLIPNDLEECIHCSIASYARTIFSLLSGMPYEVARKRMKEYYNYAFCGFPIGKDKMSRRYESLPFPLFFVIERVRITRNSIVKKVLR